MSAALVVGVDCSTTAVKAIVWDAAGNAVASGRAELPLVQDVPGHAEQDAEDWWLGMAAALRQATAGIDPADIAALCVTHQRESFVCLDSTGAQVRPAMLWLDARATAEVAESGTEDVHRVTGKPPNTTPSFYKLLWMRKHEPDNLTRTAHVVDVHGYLVYRLTDAWRTSVASADPMGLVDVATGDYDDGLLAQVGLHRDQLSQLVQPGDPIGTLTADAAAQCGLPVGLQVIAGAGDGQCGGLGAGVTAPGRAFVNLGTGMISGSFSERYVPDRAYRALTGAVAGTFSYETFTGGGTYMVTWFIDTFVPPGSLELEEGDTVEQQLSREAAAVPVGSQGLLVLPYWLGALSPYWDHDARGIILGLTGSHGRGHLFRAVLEGLSFELRLGLEEAGKGLDVPVASLVAMGGGTRSALWCQMLADVLRRPITIAEQAESTCLGAGMLAAAAVGLHPTVRAASDAMRSDGATFAPDPVAADEYDRLFEVYRQIYPVNKSLLAQLTATTS